MATTRRVFLSSALALATSLGRSQSTATNTGCTSSTSSGSVVEPSTDQIHQIVQNFIGTAPAGAGVAVGLASPSFEQRIVCIGSLDGQRGDSIAFTADTPFEIASVTKTVTASIYELLVLSGRIRSGDTLGGFFGPELNRQIQAIPLINLANYTSGLPADNESSFHSWPSSAMGDYTIADMLNYLSNSPFTISDPGKYTYSNLGFSLLALALQAAAPPTASRPHGRENSFGLCYEQILGPLGMVQTQPYSERMKATLPLGFDPNGNVASPGWGPFPAYYGAGGLVSTPNDMMTWLQFNMGIIQAASLNDILPVTEASAAPGLSGSTVPGLGWFITTMQEGGSGSSELTFIQKNGALSGASSQMAFLARNGCPTSNAGVFVLTNLGNTPPSTSTATKIAYDLLFVMAGLQPPY